MSIGGFKYVGRMNYIICDVCHLKDFYFFLKKLLCSDSLHSNSSNCINPHKIFGEEWVHNLLVNPFRNMLLTHSFANCCIKRIFRYYLSHLHDVSCELCFQSSVYCTYCEIKFHTYKFFFLSAYTILYKYVFFHMTMCFFVAIFRITNISTEKVCVNEVFFHDDSLQIKKNNEKIDTKKNNQRKNFFSLEYPSLPIIHLTEIFFHLNHGRT